MNSDVKFIQIATGSYDNDGTLDFVLYGLDTTGAVWYFSVPNGAWKRISRDFEE